jgi:acyl dehydratase
MSVPDLSVIEVGDELEPTTVRLDKAFVATHARALDMPFPRFTDDDGARREGLPGQITPGNMSLALLARALLAWAPQGRLLRLGTTFRGIALAGIELRIHGTVTEKDEEAGTIECDLWMENEEGDRLVIGTATLSLS